MPFTKNQKIWNHDISLPALQHIMTHEKSFVTFYMDTHFQNHCMIFTMHDSLQVASDSVSSPHRFFNPLILCADFCFSSFLIWALIAFNSRESFFLPNPWIPSAMVMAMSIYRTLCVLVFLLKISLLEMLIAVGNQILEIIFSEIRLWTSMLEMSLANRFKNLYRGQLFIFCLFFFLLKISLLEMLIAVGNEHLKIRKKGKNEKKLLFSPDLYLPFHCPFLIFQFYSLYSCCNMHLYWNTWTKIKQTGDQYSAAFNCLTVGGCMIRVVCFTLGSWISY